MVPVIRVSHRDDEAKATAPVSTHSNLCFTASTGRLVGAVDVCGNLNKVYEQARNIPDQFFADVFEFESDVL
jgi:hypothetical protein